MNINNIYKVPPQQHLDHCIYFLPEHLTSPNTLDRGFPCGWGVKNPPAMQETQEMWVWYLNWEDPLEKEMATHSSIPAWEIPQTEESGRLQSMALQESDTTEQLNNDNKHIRWFIYLLCYLLYSPLLWIYRSKESFLFCSLMWLKYLEWCPTFNKFESNEWIQVLPLNKKQQPMDELFNFTEQLKASKWAKTCLLRLS